MTNSTIPKHVAIIMDGNGRWAQRRKHPRIFGHVRGCARIKPIVREAKRLGVEVLTFYAFSTENWSRPESELSILWKLLQRYLDRETAELDRENVRLRVIGEVDRLDPEIQQTLGNSIRLLKDNDGLNLNFAVSYGSRRELVRAAQLFAEDCVSGKAFPSDLSESAFTRYLWTSDLESSADVDLVIRTSGEKRVSNFLLWQAAYAEYVFVDLCWPDFGPADFNGAIREYLGRDRRYGGVGTIYPSVAESTPSL